MDTRFWNKRTLYQHVDTLRWRLTASANIFPISSIELANHHIKNLTLELIPFPSNNICGILYKGDKSTSIGLNASRTPEMQNFDCMHELIHYFFHDIHCCRYVCCEGNDGCSRIKQDQIQEWQANEGAAQFLVPYQNFIPRIERDLIDEFYVPFSKHVELAEYYNVSIRVIRTRLYNLRYEIYQYHNGVPIESLEILSNNQLNSRNIYIPCYSYHLTPAHHTSGPPEFDEYVKQLRHGG